MKLVQAEQLREWLDVVLTSTSPDQPRSRFSSTVRELAVLDVREAGQFGEGHLFFAIPLPFSQFENRIYDLVPRLTTPIVLIDQNDGVAARAAAAAEASGYTDINLLEGGVQAWQQAGFNLFKGVNVPSKTFGEMLEISCKTPHISAEELFQRQQAGEMVTVIDGRPAVEFQIMSIPAATCCPNGELVLRADSLIEHPDTLVVINCAGRTRSILGAQSLIDAGFNNPVVALENGTQGWVLAGFELENGKEAVSLPLAAPSILDARRQHIKQLALSVGVEFIDSSRLKEFSSDKERTLYLFDVRSYEEFAEVALEGSSHAPGGQLVQATDRWVAVRGARIVLLDNDGLRAPMCAYWLRQLGHEAFTMQDEYTVEYLVTAYASLHYSRVVTRTNSQTDNALSITVTSLTEIVKPPESAGHDYQIIDLRPSAEYRDCHIDGAIWSVRPRIELLELDIGSPVLLVGNEQAVYLVASDLQACGYRCCWLEGSGESNACKEWELAGVPLVKSGLVPADEERIDYLFFTAGRHKGNRADSLLYLEWEQDLLNQIDDQERNSFHLTNPR